jgi:hypothetical protein
MNSEQQDEQQTYVPASIYKRIYAWIGVVYMVIIVLLTTYFIATTRFLTGLTGIMLAPALLGFSVAKGVQAHEQEYAADRVGPIVWCVLSGLAGVACLIWGIMEVIGILAG